MPVTEFEITPLWANTLLIQPLGDHAPHSARLGELSDQGVGDALFDTDDAAVNWLKANIIHGVGTLLGTGGFTGEPQIAIRARLEGQALGDYTSLVNRPGSYLTGLYVIRAPADKPALGSRDDGRPGSISFYDPRIGMNMNAINKDPYVLYHHTVPFEPGLLLLWPAYVPCYVHPHLNDAPALRVRLDVQVAASGGA